VREFSDPDLFRAELKRRLPADALVGIDGWIGAGKSTLARFLASECDGRHIEVDRYVRRDEGFYVHALKVEKLKSTLLLGRGAQFVEGVCLRAIFQAAGLVPDVHVYVKRMAIWGWADEIELTDPFELPDSAGASLRQELRSYHEKWMPQTSATYVYLWQG
jgi:hypothetical protein